MQTVTCPYTKISQSAAEEIAKKNILRLDAFSFVAKAHAQGVDAPQQFVNNVANVSGSINQQLTVPFYFLILSFFGFVILMSVVYIYHWSKFAMNDPFIKNFIPIFFFGLVLLSVPLIFNLFF